MAPFTLLAPVIGPLLDRLPHGRRAAMAGAMLARALLAITMSGRGRHGRAGAVPGGAGVLVSIQAYGVVRSAVVPRLLPPKFSLVKANSRVTLAGLLATGVAAPIGAGLQTVGSAWPLYGACAIFIVGTFLAFTMPPKVDSAKGERRARLIDPQDHPHLPHLPEPVRRPAAPKPKRGRNGGRSNREKPPKERPPGLRSVGGSVLHLTFQANAAHRALSGFLIFFLAFLLREHPMGGQSAAVSLAIVGVSAGVGNACGTAVGAWLRRAGPR
ncbi:MFS transporter OS=Streptomyces cyaneofuscatus OX=66883 GN=G3I52_20265 PE=4 SV=1 [Streptomyces cyaneofuscatus]